MKNSDTAFAQIVGSTLVGTGEFIDTTMDFVGDVAGAVVGTADALVDGAKKVAAVVTNTIVDVCTEIVNGATSIWNRLFS